MQTLDSPYLSIIIPVFNEGMKVLEGVNKLETAVFNRYPSELIIVDDGSHPDGTPPYDKLVAENPRIQVLRNPENRGKGYSVKRGIAAARGTFIFYTDADVAYDLALLPSYIENMPVSVMEAMAARLPIVASRVGAVPGMLGHGERGYLIDPGDIDSLTRAVLGLLDDRHSSEVVAQSAQEYAAQTWDRPIVAKMTARLYAEVLGSH